MYKKLLILTGLSILSLVYMTYKPNVDVEEVFGNYMAVIGWLVIASIVASIYKFGKFIVNKINE